MNLSPSFYVFKAGAGSGKTFNLVKQYLTMAFADARDERLQVLFRSILAITFTNKAANEMKERIVATLIALAQGRDDKMAPLLQEELHIDADELQRRAAVVLNAVLHNYSDLSVCTIDSFMQRLVRTFARELQLPLNFGIELDVKYITATLVDRLMAMVGAEGQEDLTEVLCAYGNSKMDDGKSYHFDNLLHETAERLFNEEAAGYLQRLEPFKPTHFKEAYEKLKADNRNLLQRCRQEAADALATCNEHHVTEKSTGLSNIYKWLVKVKESEQTLATIGKTALKIQADGVADAKGRYPVAVEQAILQAIDHIVADAKLYHTRLQLMGCYYNLAVLGELQRLREEYYRDNELTDLTEISHKINEVVRESPVPYLYERLGDRYRHFLIDEFQDTSQEQWSNLLPLLLNGVATGRRSLVVGDAKQAIYRFRQGDVRQFLRLPQVENVAGDYSLLQQTCHEEQLSFNRRTLPEVVHFNNRFFAWLVCRHHGDNELLQHIYIGAPELLARGVEQAAGQTFGQHCPPGKEGGSVQITFCSKEPAGDDPLRPLYAGAWEMIRRQHALGYSMGDITVLADKNKTLSAFAAYLADKKLRDDDAETVRCTSSESMLLASSTVVQLLRALLRHLHTPDERLHQLYILHYLWQLGLLPDNCKEQLMRQTASPDGERPLYAFSLQDYLQEQGYHLSVGHLQSLPLYELCEELLRIFPLEGRESAFTASLLNFVARYGNTHRQSLGEFLDYLDRKLPKLSSRTPADSNAIRLMTVHKSKGLESPVILYLLPKPDDPPATHWVTLPDKSISDIDVALVSFSKEKSTLFDDRREQERQETEMDNVNRTYVAFTRPQHKLLMVVEEDKAANTSLNTRLYQYAVEETDNGRCHKETEQDSFCFGSDQDKETCNKQNSNNTPSDKEEKANLARLSFPPWQERIIVAGSGNAQRSPALQKSIRRGVELHELLAHIRHADHLDSALAHYTRLHACSQEHGEELRTAVEQLLHHPTTAPFFAPAKEVKTECSLCYRGATLRPDRMVLHDNETWVVDFKTGTPLPSHADQVTNYCRAMTSMGYPQVKGYLIYLGHDEPQVVPVA